MDYDPLWKFAVIAAAALILIWRLVGVQRRDQEGRAGMLEQFLPEIDRAVTTWSPWSYPRVEGWLDGSPVRVDLIPDTLVTRTLPTLWLQLRWAQAYEGRLCVTVDPVGAEFFSSDADCGRVLAPPDSWRARTEVHADGRGGILLRRLSELDPSIYPSLKQLSVLPGELKVTLRIARGERTIYRVARAAKFDPDCVTTEIVAEAVAVARAARDVLMNEEEAG
jgi:hypothetical protein